MDFGVEWTAKAIGDQFDCLFRSCLLSCCLVCYSSHAIPFFRENIVTHWMLCPESSAHDRRESSDHRRELDLQCVVVHVVATKAVLATVVSHEATVMTHSMWSRTTEDRS